MEGKWFKEVMLLGTIQVLISKFEEGHCDDPNCTECDKSQERKFGVSVEFFVGEEFHFAKMECTSQAAMHALFNDLSETDVEELYMETTGLNNNWKFN